ncbi:GumC family protein [Cohaesibacter celericrescens]|uniref:GumC family protein n=1 Tax=Cohaesibacter celericrescens TaxID=2067669 RepID=UPI003568673D
MFGRKKKKSDLDWQPSSKPEQGTTKAMARSSASQARAFNSDHSINEENDQSDVWTGLIHPRAMLNFFRKNAFSISMVAALVVVAGLAIYFVLPDTYATKALILVDPRQPQVTSSETVLSGIGGDAAALASYVEIMNSDGFLDKVVDQLDVADDPAFADATNKTELIGMFRENMSATRQGATYIVEVYYKSKVKENAAKYANGMAEAFVSDQNNIRRSSSEEATTWLLERLTLLQTNLTKSENAVAAYQARNGIVEAGAQGTLDNQQLTSLVGQLATAKTELAEARARYEQARKDGVPASANLNQSGQFTNLDQLMQEQSRLRRSAAELSQTLGARHPRMLANKEQQRIIATQISQERRRLVQRTKQSYETAEAKKQSLERQLADARARSIQLNKAMVELATLEREASANRNLYEQFLARYKLTDEQSQLQFSEARIVSKAPIPFKSTKPSLKLVLPVLFVLGFGFGVLVALIKEAFAMPQQQNNRPSGRSSMSYAGVQTQQRVQPVSNYLDRPVEEFLNEPKTALAHTDRSDSAKQIKPKEPLVPVGTPEINDPQPDESDTIIHWDRSKANMDATASPAQGEVERSKRAVIEETEPSGSAVLLTLPDMREAEGDDEDLIDDLVAGYHEAIEQFLDKNLEEDNVSLLVTSAHSGGAQDITADILREFAIDAGFHPVVISIQDRRQNAQQVSHATGQSQAPERVARLQEYESFDLIPFVCSSGISNGAGLAGMLSQELSSLIALCKENYGFVILETRQILDPDTLEDLMDLVDSSLLVLAEKTMTASDLQDWQDWASTVGVGLVLDQTQN